MIAAACIADGARLGAGAFRSDTQAAAGVDAGDAAAAGADGMDVDDGQPQREAGDFAFGGARDYAGAEGDVGAGAAHVEGDDARAVLFAGELGQSKGADHAARGAAEDEAGRFTGGLGWCRWRRRWTA